MADDVSVECLWDKLNAAHYRGRAAQSTVEGLMFSLRSGIRALGQPEIQGRISELREEQLHEVGARLKPEIAREWAAADIERLVETWVARHA
jgi:hypothetical protein